jgi:hypothetical protein
LDFSHAYLLLIGICRPEISRWRNELEGTLAQSIELIHWSHLAEFGLLGHSVENIASIISAAITPASEHVPLAAYLNPE